KRFRDLLDLTYRFQDLVLEHQFDTRKWQITPDRRLAAFVEYRHPAPTPQVPADCDDPPVSDHAASRYERRSDPRPLLVVQFPPQHIGEQAFFRRLQPDPVLRTAPSDPRSEER